MERSEPALVPEWLKGSNGGITGGGSSLHHFASSLQSDDLHSQLSARKRLSVSSSDHDTTRPSGFSDRISSSHFRRSSSSNGSTMRDKDSTSYTRSYTSFGRAHRDRDWEKDLEKEFLLLGDHHDFSDSLALLTNRMEKDTLRRSRSMVSGKQGDVWPRKAGNEPNNGPLVGTSSSSIVSPIHKSTFERDFPSLGAEEKATVPEVGRVSSPGLTAASQSLPMSSSTVIGGDGWTSALAEVPVIIGGSSILSPVPQSVPASSANVPPSTSTGLNMAETLAQAPSRARTAPQLSVETQRLEELAIKQSRQLIPMTPSMPKTSASSSEKPKPKVSRGSELSTVAKVGQQASQHVNHTHRGSTRSDILKLSQSSSSKLLVLKGREKNGVSPAAVAKEAPGSANASRLVLGVGPPSTFAPPLKSPNGAQPKKQGSSVTDRRPLSQAQNRNDFFNSLRKKVSSANHNHSSASSDSSSLVLPSLSEKSELQMPDSSSVPEGKDAAVVTPGSEVDWEPTENGAHVAGDGDACDESETFSAGDIEKNLAPDDVVFPNEEEAAFLKSLGWEENGGEEEALTEEEIKAFYEEYTKLKPSAKLCRGSQQLNNLPLESPVGCFGGTSSVLSSSESEAERA
ncbi:flocculation protein FLO11-like [Aristolochia californica]|uniref:flocculation protein FLO11-like n=1 Tax=Aristolochia californica TaxID=171875 RepID=UPI0035E342E0